MTPLVHIVDDDAPLCAALGRLFRSVGIASEAHGSVAEFLEGWDAERTTCVLVDVRLPGLSGLELQRLLSRQGVSPPVIVMTGFGSIPMSVQAMKDGAVDFLPKPFRDQDVLDAVARAFERDELRRSEESRHEDLRRRLASLTRREKEVMDAAVSGRTNREIADALGLSDGTVKIHRGAAMRKMGTRSLAVVIRALRESRGHEGVS